MGNQYKLTLSNQTLYREVDLTDDMDSVTIGTAGGCDVRLRKELFFDTFELQLTRRGDKWEIICSESVYISVDQVRRLMVRELSHGDHMQLLYRSTDNELLTIDFEIDFESEVKDYHRVIDLGARAKFQLGTDQGSDILLSGGSLRRDILVFQIATHCTRTSSARHMVCAKTVRGSPAAILCCMTATFSPSENSAFITATAPSARRRCSRSQRPA